MANLFSGLEAFGLKNLSKMDVYEEKEKETSVANEGDKKPTVKETDFIYDKSYSCPVCDNEFKSKMVKAGRFKLQKVDTDLRPIYQFVDPLKYDAIACPKCGYAALSRYFKYVTSAQSKAIKKDISANFKPLNETNEIYTYDDAIMRHKLVLVNTIVKKAKNSERAYTCLKLAWLLRGKSEELPEDTQDYQKVIDQMAKEELEFLKNAYEGFDEAFSTENFPMSGMDENTVSLMVADLARRIGKYDECGRWISKVLVSRDANERIKEKARDIKEMLQEAKKEESK